MPHDYGRQGHSDNEEAHKIACLARHVCRLGRLDPDGGLRARRMFINRMQITKGEAFATRLREAVKQQWNKLRAERRVAE